MLRVRLVEIWVNPPWSSSRLTAAFCVACSFRYGIIGFPENGLFRKQSGVHDLMLHDQRVALQSPCGRAFAVDAARVQRCAGCIHSQAYSCLFALARLAARLVGPVSIMQFALRLRCIADCKRSHAGALVAVTPCQTTRNMVNLLILWCLRLFFSTSVPFAWMFV